MKIDYNQIAQAYDSNRKTVPPVLAGLLDVLPQDSSPKVLEVGCGTGNFISAIAELAGCACWGIDPSEKMLGFARERSRQVQFSQGSGEEPGLVDAFFDLIFSVDVIHHVQDRPAYFRQVWRMLKPGGLVCTVTDSEEDIRARPILTGYFPETVAVELKRYPPIQRLQAEMAAAGLLVTRCERVNYPYELTDIRPFREKAFSSLHLISDEAHQRGVARLEADLQKGPIPSAAYYTMLWGEK